MPKLGKQRKRKLRTVAKRIAAGKSQEEASKGVISQQTTSKYLKKNTAGFRDMVLKEFEKNGVTPEKIAERLGQGLDAVQYTKQGEPMTDYKTRLAYISKVSDMTGLDAPKEVHHEHSYTQLLEIIGVTSGQTGQEGVNQDLEGATEVRAEVLEDQDEGYRGTETIEAEFQSAEAPRDSGAPAEGDREGEDHPPKSETVRGNDVYPRPILSQSRDTSGLKRRNRNAQKRRDREDLSDEQNLLGESPGTVQAREEVQLEDRDGLQKSA